MNTNKKNLVAVGLALCAVLLAVALAASVELPLAPVIGKLAWYAPYAVFVASLKLLTARF